MNGSAKFFGGLLLGTAVGVVTGMLIAPTTGNQARKSIVKKSKVYSQQAIDAVRQYIENMRTKGRGDEVTAGADFENFDQHSAY